MRKFREYLKENWKEHIENYCRSCHAKTDVRLVHKETMVEYPFCQECVDKGFYNEEIFEVKNNANG